MNPSEYETMFQVEEWHWWYRGLQSLLKQSWNGNVSTERPRLLDIGCGTGANMAVFSSQAKTAGMDICPGAIRFCRKRNLPVSTVGSALSLPFDDQAFDVVVCTDVLYHRAVSDPAEVLREAHRVLRPGGLVFLNVPAYEWLRSSHDEAIHTGRRFTRPEMTSLIRDAGLEPVRVTYWNTLLFPLIALARLWRRGVSGGESQAESDFHKGSGAALNGLFSAILGLERTFLRVTDLPFGVSVFAVARKG
jgi:SAM-dependent methyltransferase